MRVSLKKFLLFVLFSLFSIETAFAKIIIQSNWQYTTATTSHSADASATYQPLDFTNLLNKTSATGTGDAKAYEDLTGGNDASVNLVYSFDFLVDRQTMIGLGDRLAGFLFLGDTDSAHVDTFARIIDQATNAVVASLPIRSHTRSGSTGTDTFDEVAHYYQHIFNLMPGDYLLQAGLNLSAHATSGVGDDRMESSSSYTVDMYNLPEPSTFSLLVFGGLGVLLSVRFGRQPSLRGRFF